MTSDRPDSRLFPALERPVSLPAGDAALEGSLALPVDPAGVVVFAHGDGNSRHSPRNRFVADILRERGLGTLLIDLLTSAEESEDLATGRLRFDIPLFTGRVVTAIDWLSSEEETATLPIGAFGASTGAAAALSAAVARPDRVQAVVSRGGRPDLVTGALPDVKAPTLLIVGGEDRSVIELNQHALGMLRCEKHLEIVVGATHRFEEAGALEHVAAVASGWFLEHIPERDGHE